MIVLHIASLIYTVVFLVGCTHLLIVTPTPRQFPKGHIRAYDPTGEYTYADQNPNL